VSGRPDVWARAYRPLRPRSLAVQLGVLVAAEVLLFASYGAHDARFHWATHFLVGLAFASLWCLARLLLTGAPGPRFLLMTVLGFHLYAMLPDLLFRGGVPHYRWMDVFLGHVAAHYVPGGDFTWFVVAALCAGLYAAALTAWLRARRAEALAGMAPGVGVTGAGVLRPQADPRAVPLAHDHAGPDLVDSQEVVVLVHGLGASSKFWRPVAEVIAGRGVRVLSPEPLGFGRSRGIGTHFHLDDQAAALNRLVADRAARPAVLVGHSYGAAVAVAAAGDRPDLYSRLVLVSPAAFADTARARQRLGARSWLARRTMDGSPVADMACGAMCLFRRPLSALAPRAVQGVDADIARDGVAHIWPAYRDALDSLLEDNPLPAWLADPPLPTTVVLGDDDRTVPADDVAPLLSDDADVRRVQGTHLLPVERPEDLARAVLGRT
jgi:pimeloyl-ACP methyl ester carboxylesterase